MANGLVNASGMGEEILGDLTPLLLDKISPLVTVFKVVGIALLIYIIFLIIKALFRWRTMSKIGKISKNVEQINEKLDLLIKKYKPEEHKEEKKKKEEQEEKKKEKEKKPKK